ncbi:SchA/CurD-like domain-containing protein [Streptomyces sp. SL13]|jgi:quinol monooxygenase YgiN|uniref:SchA/CurD-like domain-containing protein n=1 Tax=Streptantibioticus silvisoli TaxID=2705255 RepID=A0AA90H8B6_9ACTN|nr:SchA/CurD-like domain-containing protein [Streptantibioticus silvisoli]MDI5961731.1 SchA/CurD-like domain-containing protein [Streptantibioticus silvisoli]MDI5972347.1 SchA/CurD-like domain-containing protein [Streptantibioticus silvisoli]
MTPLAEKVSQSALDGSRLRVVLQLEVEDGAEQRFLDAYDQMCRRVAAVPGHISDQLCQSIENPSQWLLTSEWESALPFLSWVDSPAHLEMVGPWHGCVRDTRSMRFAVLRETGNPRGTTGKLQAGARMGDGIVRHAITFTVKPGSEEKVAGILAGYTSPRARVDDTTRLRRTSLFMHGNRVVRAVEVEGELVRALRHVAMQPEVRAVEEAINPYLEQERDLSDPRSARDFFARAALPAVHHVGPRQPMGEVIRHALHYPVKPGCGQAVAKLLARMDERAVGDADGPVASSTVFLREDTVVRLVDLRRPLDQVPLAAIGVPDARKAAVLARLLRLEDGEPPLAEAGVKRFLADCDMRLVTDRQASGA